MDIGFLRRNSANFAYNSRSRKPASVDDSHGVFGLERWTKSVETASLLLARGADPNASVVPVPVLFFAVKNSDAETVRQLLLKGAKANFISSKAVGAFCIVVTCYSFTFV